MGGGGVGGNEEKEKEIIEDDKRTNHHHKEEHDKEEERELTWFQKLYKPEYKVEPSFFFYQHRGRKHEKMPLKYKIGMHIDEITHTFFRPEELEGFADFVVISTGLFMRFASVFVYAWFIATTYISESNVTFISLDETAGVCAAVPVAITNTYTMDVNGYWNGNINYNPTLGMYSINFNNFLHSADEYALFMQNAKYNFETYIAAKAPSQDLATNLLYWMTYSYFVDDGLYSHRWKTSGDPKVVLDRTSYLGSLGNQKGIHLFSPNATQSLTKLYSSPSYSTFSS